MTTELVEVSAAAHAVAAPDAMAGPMAMALQAIKSGMSIADMRGLLDLQKEWQADEARKAFVADMAAFKKNPPEILKDKHVSFTTQKGTTSYDHATIGNVCDQIVKAAADHGFSHRWIPGRGEHGALVVTCEVTHRMGHVQLTTLEGPRDDTGNKNPLQGEQSTRTYLQRNSLLLAFGFATKDQPDDDGRGMGGAESVVDGWIVYVNDAATPADLAQIRKEAVTAFNDVGDVAGWNRVKVAIEKQSARLNESKA